MSFGGHGDWRLPNGGELQSIVDYQTFNPPVASAFDANCAPGCSATTCSCTALGNYWSSTSSVSEPGRAWYVGFRYGNVDAWGVSGGKSATLYVRAVHDAGSSSTTTTSTSSTTTTRPSTTSTTTSTTTSITISTTTSTTSSTTSTTTTSS